jgi:predicted permease
VTTQVPHPPRLAETLLGVALDARDRDCVLSDLEEEFEARLARESAHDARAWYWRQAVTSLIPALSRRWGQAGGARVHRPSQARLEPVLRDAREAIKALLRKPWYTSSILIVTALGFALLTSVFAIVDGVLFKPLSYAQADQLYAMDLSSSRSRSLPRLSADDVDTWSKAVPTVAFTGFRVQPAEWNHDVNPFLTGRALVQSNFFDVIGVRPAIGGFTADDFEVSKANPAPPPPGSSLIGPSAPPAAAVVSPAAPRIEPRIVTEEVFRAQVGGDLGAIGRTVVTDPLTGSGYRIVGVMPHGFIFPSDWWTVGYLAPCSVGPDIFTQFIARLPPGVPASDVQFRVLAVATAADRAAAAAGTNPTVDRVNLQRLDGSLGADSRSLFTALLVGAALLVLVAALNASSLMAARSFDRGPEWVMRRALGATALDTFRLLLVEAMLLMGTGAAIGLTLAAPLLRFTRHLLPENLALLRPAAIDWRVAAFAAAAAIVLASLSTIWPLRRSAASQTLAAGRNATGRARAAGRRLVVTVQVAGALVLTVAGALLVGSLLTVYAHTPAITSSGVITIQARWAPEPASNPGWAQARADRLKLVLGRLQSLPEVESVAATATELLSGGIPGSGQAQFSYPATARTTRLTMDAEAVTADYYRVVRPQLVAGRLPTDAELAHNDPVLVVSEGVAANDWPNAPAVGQSLTLSWGTSAVGQTFTVVGVVKDVHWFAWDRDAVSIYGPYDLLARDAPTFLIRTAANQARVTADALQAIQDTDPRLRPQHVAMLDDLFVDSVRPRRFQAWLFGSFAAASLIVVGIGILGQLAMSTVQRTREVGIRMACGATRDRIVVTLAREELVPVIAGLAAGGIGATWAVRYIRSYLYDLTVFDARIWSVAIGLILVTAAIGTLIPAVSASRIDPTQALRAE